jgi:SAM-dependent methyltransferase
VTTLLETERAKYESAWDLPAYARYSPGARFAPIFMQLVKAGASVLDAGCGRGDGGRALVAAGFSVTFLDLVDVIPQDLQAGVRFFQQTLWDELPLRPEGIYTVRYDYAFCCDVLEHVPTELVGLVLHRLREVTKSGFFTIGLKPDAFGELIGAPLHLTVRPFTWWRDFLKIFGKVIEARDLGDTGLYLVRWDDA